MCIRALIDSWISILLSLADRYEAISTPSPTIADKVLWIQLTNGAADQLVIQNAGHPLTPHKQLPVINIFFVVKCEINRAQ